jgi:hypothetical protein
MTIWLVHFASQKIPIQPGWYPPWQKIPLAENNFLQTSKGDENTNEKSTQCFMLKKQVCNNNPWMLEMFGTFFMRHKSQLCQITKGML